MTTRRTAADLLARATPHPGPLPTPCAIFPTLDTGGYGHARLGGGWVRVHRAVYEHHVGPIPPGVTLDHLCRVRACCAPDHLQPVTHRENVLRGTGPTAVNAAKTECVHGHPLSGDNLVMRRDGGRDCRTCRRAREARAYIKRKARRDRLA